MLTLSRFTFSSFHAAPPCSSPPRCYTSFRAFFHFVSLSLLYTSKLIAHIFSLQDDEISLYEDIDIKIDVVVNSFAIMDKFENIPPTMDAFLRC